MTKDQGALAGVSSTTVDGAKDEMEFLGFLPERSSVVAHDFFGCNNHSQPVLGLPCFLLAGADLAAEFLLRHSFIGLTIVCANGCSRADQMIDKRQGNDVLRNPLSKRD